MKRLDLEGKQFERWTVIEFHSMRLQQSYFRCICQCGKEKLVAGRNLVNGTSKSCGCLHYELKCDQKYTGGKYLSGKEFSILKYNANKRKLEFNITIQDIEEIFEKQNFKCKYSGLVLEFKGRNRLKKKGTASVDRIDSSKGYTVDNIQIVHRDINQMKWNQHEYGFVDWCCIVADYQRKLIKQ